MKRIYLAGPMSGIPDDNFPAFDAAAEDLRSQGYTVVNPTEFGEEAQGVAEVSAEVRARYLQLDLLYMLPCDAIALLNGWYNSIGANVELVTAISAGLTVYTVNAGHHLVLAAPTPNWELVQEHVKAMLYERMWR